MIQRVHRSPYVQCQTAQALVLPCFVNQTHWSAMLAKRLPCWRASHYPPPPPTALRFRFRACNRGLRQ